MRVCGLEMTLRELFQPDDKPQFMDVLALKRVLLDMKQHRNKTRVHSFTGVIDSGLTKLETLEEELRRSQLDATELAQVPICVLKNLEDCMNVTTVEVEYQQFLDVVSHHKKLLELTVYNCDLAIRST
eukprot:gene8632-13354_t